jgi:hypothetical protein
MLFSCQAEAPGRKDQYYARKRIFAQAAIALILRKK